MSAALHAHGYDSDRVAASVVRILGGTTLCSMATRNDAGMAHISMAFFCFCSDLVLYFLSHPESVHCRNLVHSPQMAVAVFDSHQVWGEPHAGLQLFGTGERVSAEAEERVRALYAARFPRYRELLTPTAASLPPSSTFPSLTFYRFLPRQLQILDEWEFGEEVFLRATVLR